MNNPLRAPAPAFESLENRVLLSVVTVAPIDVAAAGTPGQAVFTATLDVPSASPITLSYATVNGTAHAGRDYRRTVGSIIIPAGASSATFSVPLLANVVTEPNLNFLVKLKVTPGNIVAPTTGATIIENQVPPTVAVADAIINKPANGLFTTADIVLSLSNPSAQKVSVDYQTEDGTAVGGKDYVAVPAGTVEFKKRQTSADFKVKIIGNFDFTPDEVFDVAIDGATNATVPRGTFSRVVIREVNPNVGLVRPNLTISSPSAVRGENEVFTLTLSAASKFPVSARYSTSPMTANDSQYTSKTGLITIPAGQTTATITVPTVEHTDVNTDTTFRLNLSAVANAQLATADPTATILAYPSIVASGADVNEQDTAPTSPAVFSILLNDPSPLPVTVSYSTADGTTDPTVVDPAVANVDYIPTSGTVTIPAGQTSATVSAFVLADPNAAASMTFFLNLADAVNGVIANGTAPGTITNDPTPVGPPVISITPLTTQPFSLANGDDVPETFAVTLSAASTSTVTVNYSTTDGTAINGRDYTGVSGTLVFTPGETEQDFNVAVAGSSTVTEDRDFTAALSNPSNATLAVTGSTATSTITELGLGAAGTDTDVADNLSNVPSGSQTATVTTWLAAGFTVGDLESTVVINNPGDNGNGGFGNGGFGNGGGFQEEEVDTAFLQSVNLLLDNATGLGAQVAIYSGAFEPTTFVAALNGPTTFSSTPAVATFTPQSGIELEAGLQYWVVLATTSGGAFQWSTTADVTGSGIGSSLETETGTGTLTLTNTNTGFTPLAATSPNSGTTWATRATSPFQFNVIVTPVNTLLLD